MARWMQCRLIPAHKDTEAQQLQAFPMLQTISAQDKGRLLSKFHYTDDLSYYQYLATLS